MYEVQYEDAGISYLDTWKAMEKCAKLGLAKSIGISNFNIKQVKDILRIATIIPAVNQVISSMSFNYMENKWENLILFNLNELMS